MEQVASNLSVIPLGELYSRLDASERTPTVEVATTQLKRLARPLPPIVQPVRFERRALRAGPPPRAVARPTPRPARPSPPALQQWLETPHIGLSHVLVLLVSGLSFGVGLSAFALLALARLPGLEFLGL